MLDCSVVGGFVFIYVYITHAYNMVGPPVRLPGNNLFEYALSSQYTAVAVVVVVLPEHCFLVILSSSSTSCCS